MFVVAVAVVTVVAWGSWIGLADSARSATVAGRTLRATIGNAGLAVAVTVTLTIIGHPFPHPGDLAWPFAGGLLWAAGNFCAFRSTAGLGIARAAGIWTSVNILTALAWGAFVFHEFDDITRAIVVRLVLALAAVLSGLLLILAYATTDTASVRGTTGTAVAAALGAGVLWGSYFIPVEAADIDPAAANLPLAVGMVTGALGLAVVTDRGFVRLRTRREEIVVLAAGVLWGIGNLGMLLLVDRIGAGRGFTIAQLGLIVNALIGIVAFQNPRPRSRAALITLTGVVLAAAGGVLVGQSR